MERKNKKIICLIERLGPGGAQRQLVGLSSLLVKYGYDVELWSWVKEDFFKNVLLQAGVKYKCIESAQNKFRRIFVLRRELLHTSPDVVISYLDTPSMIACLIKACGAKFKLVVSDRNTTQINDLRNKLKFFFNRFSDKIVPNSYAQQAYITTHYPALSNKVEVITNFVDLDKFKPSNVVQEVGDRIRLIVVARISKQKNPIFLIEVIDKLHHLGYNINVDWYGRPLDTNLYNDCIDKIKDLGLEDVFAFKSDTDKIAEVYPMYDIFCLPSLWEGYPNVVCEAMACGLPVVCSTVSDVPNIVEEGVNGYLFNPRKQDDAVAAFEKILLLDALERNAMGHRNREKMIINNSKDIFVQKYIDLINTL